ncbi:DUF881 domain-containing protein [Neobacillus dielmonensis]|uniref:DUF881 domain-containing protein n=1 Tax=Neobacillus dielmonensis TaxID=1347369 RepID=UPI0005AAAB8E|nr:DUF881 domain-containing protein [Neobacillus dielmonensis]
MDRQKVTLRFTLISALIGFMIAVQFQTVTEPKVRDTRDIWQLREALLKEKEMQYQLLTEIRSYEEKLSAYESKRKQSKEQALKDTYLELKQETGLTEVKGPGVTLEIEPVIEDIKLGYTPTSTVPPELLKRLVNELNMYQAESISIDGQRIINTTVIRDINTETKIDGHTIKDLPIEIKVIVKDFATAEKLYNRMNVSKAKDEFFTESLRLSVTKPSTEITVPAYENPIRIRYMESVKEGGGS